MLTRIMRKFVPMFCSAPKLWEKLIEVTAENIRLKQTIADQQAEIKRYREHTDDCLFYAKT